MALLIDTSVFIDLERQGKALTNLGERFGQEPAALAAITASELLHGVHRADSAMRRARRERFVETIPQTLPILPFDLEVARLHARLWSDLRRRGITIGVHDLLITATAMVHDLVLITGNPRDFGKVEELQWVSG